MKQCKVIDVSDISLGPQHLFAKMIQPIQIHIREKLAGQVADWQSAPPVMGRKKVVAWEMSVHRFLGVGGVDNRIGEP